MQAAVVGGARSYATVHVMTRADRALRLLRSDFYRDRKCVPSWIDGQLNDRMLQFAFGLFGVLIAAFAALVVAVAVA